MIEPQAAAANCEHHYETHILGGHPLTVRLCVFCRTPDWADLYQEAEALFRWGREEGLAGLPPRERLSAYDRPAEDQLAARPDSGPSVREAAADDRRWPLEKAGE